MRWNSRLVIWRMLVDIINRIRGKGLTMLGKYEKIAWSIV